MKPRCKCNWQQTLARDCANLSAAHAASPSAPDVHVGILGMLFRLVILERFSSRLLDAMHAELSEGRTLSGEAFAATLCARAPWCALIVMSIFHRGI